MSENREKSVEPESRGIGVLSKKPSTRMALRAAVQRAVRELEQNLSEPPRIDDLAKAAFVSRFHFQRAFKEVVGETVSQHSIRLRIERGAVLLKHSSWQITEVALACGFPSQSGFGRSFRKIYGMTPRQFRQDCGAVPFLRGVARSNGGRELPDPPHLVPTVLIDEWPNLEAVSLRFYGPVSGVYKVWNELLAWARKAIPDLESARFFGLWFDEWETDQDHYRYECTIVPNRPLTENPPAPFHLRTIEGGKVAVSQAQGRAKELDRAWKAFATGWLPFSGFQPRGEFALDEYPAEVILGSSIRKLSTGLLGMRMRMCLMVQDEPMAL